MTAALIVFLILILLAFIILPFSKDLMKDRNELMQNPLEKKFNILISRVNQLLMDDKGEITTFKSDPRQVNLFDDNHANMLIQFYYSTGTLTITLKYKFYQVELVKEMKFHNMRHAESFRQQDVANHFAEQAISAIRTHQIRVSQERGYKDDSGEYIYTKQSTSSKTDNPVDLLRGMYEELSREERLALVGVAQLVFTADGSTVESFKLHPQFSDLLLNFQVNYSEAKSFLSRTAENGIIRILKGAKEVSNIQKILPIFPFVLGESGPIEKRVDKFYHLFEAMGISQETVDYEIHKMMLLMEKFG